MSQNQENTLIASSAIIAGITTFFLINPWNSERPINLEPQNIVVSYQVQEAPKKVVIKDNRASNYQKLWRAVELTESKNVIKVHGKTPIRYEPHWFKRCLKIKGVKKKPPSRLYKRMKKRSQSEYYEILKYAKKTGFSECAHFSTSFSPFQIMGFNHKILGFDSAVEMSDSFHANNNNEYNLKMFKRFLKNYRGGKAYRQLTSYNFNGFAKTYNGSIKYARKLRANYKSLR